MTSVKRYPSCAVCGVLLRVPIFTRGGSRRYPVLRISRGYILTEALKSTRVGRGRGVNGPPAPCPDVPSRRRCSTCLRARARSSQRRRSHNQSGFARVRRDGVSIFSLLRLRLRQGRGGQGAGEEFLEGGQGRGETGASSVAGGAADGASPEERAA